MIKRVKISNDFMLPKYTRKYRGTYYSRKVHKSIKDAAKESKIKPLSFKLKFEGRTIFKKKTHQKPKPKHEEKPKKFHQKKGKKPFQNMDIINMMNQNYIE